MELEKDDEKKRNRKLEQILEKASLNGQESAKKTLCLYRQNGGRITDEAYEEYLSDFVKAVDSWDEQAYELYQILKSGTEKQLARLGYILTAAQNACRIEYMRFRCPAAPSGAPLVPIEMKRYDWKTFFRFNLDAWPEKQPLIAVSTDIMRSDNFSWLLDHFHHARVVGTARYISPSFGWLKDEKDAVLIRLGTDDTMKKDKMKEVTEIFSLKEGEYQKDSVAFLSECGEKEYSFEIASIQGRQIDILLRYTIGGTDVLKEVFDPELISVHIRDNTGRKK